MPIGHNFTRCSICGKEYVCGDCITYICRECNATRVDTLCVICPEHGQQLCKPGFLGDLALACGCSYTTGMGSGAWFKKEQNTQAE